MLIVKLSEAKLADLNGSRQEALPPVLREEFDRNGTIAGTRSTEKFALDQGHFACPSCLDTGHLHHPYTSAEGTKFFQVYDVPDATQCKCAKGYALRDWQSEVKPELPPSLRGFKIWDLVPSEVSNAPLDAQAKWLREVRDNLDGNFILCGPSGVGKTTIAAALANYAAWRTACGRRVECFFPAVWRLSAYRLLERHIERLTWSGGEDKPAELLDATMIRRARRVGMRPTLVLEEIDKPKVSDSSFGFLYDLIDELHESGGQIIVTSNLKPKDLLAFLRDEPLWRRFMGHGTQHKGVLLDMFSE